jgi:hypothetical protein
MEEELILYFNEFEEIDIHEYDLEHNYLHVIEDADAEYDGEISIPINTLFETNMREYFIEHIS